MWNKKKKPFHDTEKFWNFQTKILAKGKAPWSSTLTWWKQLFLQKTVNSGILLLLLNSFQFPPLVQFNISFPKASLPTFVDNHELTKEMSTFVDGHEPENLAYWKDINNQPTTRQRYTMLPKARIYFSKVEVSCSTVYTPLYTCICKCMWDIFSSII